jgi:hypothetical protein
MSSPELSPPARKEGRHFMDTRALSSENCHIAEHHESGMMFSFNVVPESE